MGWEGIVPSIPTAFGADGAIDIDAQRSIVRFAIDSGAHAIMCFGLAGEVLRLTPDERKSLTEVIVDETSGAVPVLVGAGAESIHTAQDLARFSQSAGVDGAVIPPPMNGSLTPGLLRDYFVSVASVVEIPVMIQDAPEYLNVAVGPELVTELAHSVPQIQYVKLEVGADGVAEWVRMLDGSAAVFGGNAGVYLLDALRAGAHGIAPGLDVVDVLVAIYERERAGYSAGADELFAQILPMLVFEMRDIDHFNLCAKHVLKKRGVQLQTGLRSPAEGLSPHAVALLDSYLDSAPLVAGAARAS